MHKVCFGDSYTIIYNMHSKQFKKKKKEKSLMTFCSNDFLGYTV